MKTAMILAAGRGERLRPMTDYQPKALCKVHNVPVIEYHVKNLALAGFDRVIINHAYLGDQIRIYLGDGERWGTHIFYSPEPPGGLETGGGIFNALPLLGETPFVTVNADIVTDYPFASLRLPLGSLVHLVLVSKPNWAEKGDFGLSKTGFLENTDRQYTFPGIACYHPDFFKECSPGRYSVAPLIREFATHFKATGEVYGGMWTDIGCLERLKAANQ